MKALLLSDEINQFHWSMLKSVMLVLSLLPLSQVFLNLLHSTDATSQIMLGFLAISIFSAVTIISFYSALSATVIQINQPQASLFEKQIIQIYRYVPMLFLAGMLSYLAMAL